MYRLLLALLIVTTWSSCSRNNDDSNNNPPPTVPNIITGYVSEFSVDPVDMTTPEKATLLVSMNNTFYRVEIAPAAQSEHNATISFLSDSILTTDSREFANFGPDIAAYAQLRTRHCSLCAGTGK
jgi:hypothetical protein